MANMNANRARGNVNPVLVNRDRQSSIEDKVGERAKKTRPTFLGYMDSIACGVEAWLEENTGHSRAVAETTAAIARALGVPQSEINRWVSCRLIRDTEKGRIIKALIERLQGSSLANRANNGGYFTGRS